MSSRVSAPVNSSSASFAGSAERCGALLCGAIFVLLLMGCGPATKAVVKPQNAAAAAYVDGLKSMSSANYLEAQQTFTKVVKMPAYLAATTVARLRFADALFAQNKFEQAVQVYQSYVRRHDGSDNVPYARFRIAQSYFQMVPSDSWLLPPTYEMDLSSVERARYYLETFVRRYPTSDYVPSALRMRDRCMALQMAQHRYVVRFYQRRKQPMGIVFRSHELLRRFPVRGHTLADYVTLADAYGALLWRRRELELRREIARRWPNQPAGQAARARVAALRNEIAQRKAEGKKDAEMPVELPPMANDRPERLAGPDGLRLQGRPRK